MRSFEQLPLPVQVIQGILTFFLLLGYLSLLLEYIRLGRSKVRLVALGALTLCCYLLFQATLTTFRIRSGWADNTTVYQWFNELSDGLWLLVLLGLTGLAVWFWRSLVRFRHHRFSVMSVKEAIDNLPVGMCYFYEGGQVLMANHLMNAISAQLTGRTVLNGNVLWQCLSERIGDGEQTIVLPDGRVFCFQRNTIFLDKIPVYELLASNITEEYALRQQLEEQNKGLEAQRDQLRRLGELVTDVTIEKEMLHAKIKIHDDLGSALIAAKRYLAGCSEMDQADLLALWQRHISLLRHAASPSREDGYRAVLQAARDVGIELNINGVLPEQEGPMSITACALNECITNTIRHAKGDALSLEIRENDTSYIEYFTNNGEPPAGTVQETGGLKNLRQMTETADGTMHIQSQPRFRLMLTIPKEGDNENGLQSNYCG